jgi:sulfite exporter TauE/SafE
LPRLRAPDRLLQIGRPLARGIEARAPIARAAILGGGSALLPCGWLYGFAATAAGTGAPLAGAALMTAFWLGSVPALLAAGIGVQALAAPLRRHVPTITALALVATGLVTVLGRLDHGPMRAPAVAIAPPADPHACCGCKP